MAHVLITGSADGLGRLAAKTLLDDGHEVVVHARSRDRLPAVQDLLDRGAAPVAGGLSDVRETRAIADQVNALGQMDAVIHNAGVYTGPRILAINTVAHDRLSHDRHLARAVSPLQGVGLGQQMRPPAAIITCARVARRPL